MQFIACKGLHTASCNDHCEHFFYLRALSHFVALPQKIKINVYIGQYDQDVQNADGPKKISSTTE